MHELDKGCSLSGEMRSSPGSSLTLIRAGRTLYDLGHTLWHLKKPDVGVACLRLAGELNNAKADQDLVEWECSGGIMLGDCVRPPGTDQAGQLDQFQASKSPGPSPALHSQSLPSGGRLRRARSAAGLLALVFAGSSMVALGTPLAGRYQASGAPLPPRLAESAVSTAAPTKGGSNPLSIPRTLAVEPTRKADRLALADSGSVAPAKGSQSSDASAKSHEEQRKKSPQRLPFRVSADSLDQPALVTSRPDVHGNSLTVIAPYRRSEDTSNGEIRLRTVSNTEFVATLKSGNEACTWRFVGVHDHELPSKPAPTEPITVSAGSQRAVSVSVGNWPLLSIQIYGASQLENCLLIGAQFISQPTSPATEATPSAPTPGATPNPELFTTPSNR